MTDVYYFFFCYLVSTGLVRHSDKPFRQTFLSKNLLVWSNSCRSVHYSSREPIQLSRACCWMGSWKQYRTRVDTNLYAYVPRPVHIYIYIQMHTHVHMHTHTRIHTYTHTHTHTYTYIHTCYRSPNSTKENNDLLISMLRQIQAVKANHVLIMGTPTSLRFTGKVATLKDQVQVTLHFFRCYPRFVFAPACYLSHSLPGWLQPIKS